MNQNPHKITCKTLGFITSKTVRSRARSSSDLVLKLHGFVTLIHHEIFQSKAKEKGMRFTDSYGQNSRPLHAKENNLPW